MEITSLVIIGAFVSVFVQGIKESLGTNSRGTYVVLLLVSILAGTAYYFLQGTSFLAALVSILGFAGATHNYLLRRLEE